MSEIKDFKDFEKITATNKQFLVLANKSSLGFALIQRGRLLYFNNRFAEIFGYSSEEISQWKKREFYKIVHPDDLAQLTQRFKVDDQEVLSVSFRGTRKDGQIIKIENYVCLVYFNGKKAMLCSYMTPTPQIQKNNKITLNLPINLYNKLQYLSRLKKKSIENLILLDLQNLIKHYEEQFSSMNLKF